MGRLLILGFAALAFGTNTFAVLGLLRELAVAHALSVPAAAQVQTAFVLAAALGGPLLAIATRRIDRKRVLVACLLGLAASAGLAAVAPGFGALLGARALAGLSGALVLPLSTAAAAGLSAPEKRGSAVATVLLGMTLALLAGAPACTALGAEFGWRASFVLAGALSAAAALAVQLGVPSLPGTADRPAPLNRATLARLAPLWTATLLSFTAAFSLTSYLSPIAGRLAGAEAGAVGLFQMVTGVGSFAGVLLGGRVSDRGAGALTLAGGLGVVGLSLAAVSLAFAAPVPSAWGAAALVGGMLGSASALFSLMPVVQSRLAVAAGASAPLALALNGSATYAGQAGGAVLGGAAIGLAGLPWAPLAGAVAAAGGRGGAAGLGASVERPAPLGRLVAGRVDAAAAVGQ